MQSICRYSRQIGILQTSLVGSLLVNVLLVPGLSFLIGGHDRVFQYHNPAASKTISGLLFVGLASLLVRVAFTYSTTGDAGIVNISRGIFVVLLLKYGLWNLFQLKSHRELFQEPSPKALLRSSAQRKGKTDPGIMATDESHSLTLLGSIVVLATCTALFTFNSLFATDSIQGLLIEVGVSGDSVGLIVLPVVTVDPMPIAIALKDKLDLTLALTMERCIQICLLEIPFITLLDWAMGFADMTLEFDTFQMTSLFTSLWLLPGIVQDGRSSW